jgi:hypothetical protein
MWVYICTHGTHLVSSRKPRGDPAENPTKHPGGTWRPTGPQGPRVCHRPLLSQPCTATKNTGEAGSGKVSAQTPSWEEECTYPGASRGYSYVHGTDMITCTGDSCYAEVGFNTIRYYVLWHHPSEKTNALLLRDRWEPSQYHQYQAIWR